MQTGKTRIKPALFHQLVMCATGDDDAFIHDNDAVGLEHSCQTMGDDQCGTAFHQTFERGLNQRFAFSIERGGRFVEQQHGRVAQDGARNGDALALTTRQRDTALTDLRFIATRQRHDETINAGGNGGGAQIFIRRIGTTIADVLADGHAEDDGFLRHDSEAATHVNGISGSHIDTIKRDAARLRIIEAQEKLEDRAFARAGRADNGHRLTGIDAQRIIIERRHMGPRRIGEHDLIESDGPARRDRQRNGLNGRGNVGHGVDEFDKALGGTRRHLHIAPDFR